MIIITTTTIMTTSTGMITIIPSNGPRPFASHSSRLRRQPYGFVSREPFPAVSVIGVVGLLIGGWPILKEAFENIIERRMTMELSMTIAIGAAAAIGEFFTALVITLFVLVAEVA